MATHFFLNHMRKLLLYSILFSCGTSFAQSALPVIEWANYATGTPGVATYSYSSCYDRNGNSFILGAFNNQSGTLDIDPSANTCLLNDYVGMFIAKYDPNGSMLWGKQIDITTLQMQSSVTPRNIACDDSGNVYITGALTDVNVDFDMANASNPVLTTAGGFDLFLAKYSPVGNLVWAFLLGSTAHEEGLSMVSYGDKLYIAGQYGCFTDFDPDTGTHVPPISQFCVSGFLACYTTNGDFVWQNSYCGPSLSAAGYGIPNTVRMDSNYDLVICGRMGGVVDYNPGAGLDTLSVQPTGGSDGFFAKFDTSGNFIFAKSLATITDMVFPYLDVDGNDNIIIAGSFNGIVDFDPSASVYTDTASDYLVSGATDVFLAKYNSSGSLLWEKSFGRTGYEDLVTLAVDDANHILLGGQFGDSVDIDFGSGVYMLYDPLNNNGLTDAFAIKYDENGNILFGFSISGASYDRVSSVSCYNEQFIISGTHTATWDFDPTSGTYTVPALTTNGPNYFHAQYFDTAMAISVPELFVDNGLFAYPNPCTEYLYVPSANEFESYTIVDAQGRIVVSSKSNSTIDVSSLAPGVYYLSFFAENAGVARMSFVKTEP